MGDDIPEMDFDIAYNDLQLLDAIGRGAFGLVYKALYFGSVVAVKQLPSQTKDEDHIKYFKREVALLKGLRHPNVVQFIGLAPKDGVYHIVTEYIAGGNLRTWLKNESIALPWSIRVAWASDIATALAYLHSKNILYRDLKSKNILVDEQRAKICDFGLARGRVNPENISNRPLTLAGTDEWMAPEVILGMDYDLPADVFSYGIVLFELISRRKVSIALQRLPKDAFGLDEDLAKGLIPPECPSEFSALAFTSCTYEPEGRPTFRAVSEKLYNMLKTLPPRPTLSALKNPAPPSSPIPASTPPPPSTPPAPVEPAPAPAPAPAPTLQSPASTPVPSPVIPSSSSSSEQLRTRATSIENRSSPASQVPQSKTNGTKTEDQLSPRSLTGTSSPAVSPRSQPATKPTVVVSPRTPMKKTNTANSGLSSQLPPKQNASSTPRSDTEKLDSKTSALPASKRSPSAPKFGMKKDKEKEKEKEKDKKSKESKNKSSTGLIAEKKKEKERSKTPTFIPSFFGFNNHHSSSSKSNPTSPTSNSSAGLSSNAISPRGPVIKSSSLSNTNISTNNNTNTNTNTNGQVKREDSSDSRKPSLVIFEDTNEGWSDKPVDNTVLRPSDLKVRRQ